jgi:hypothetical protein
MLKGKQKKLDVNKDGKISGDDFAMLKNVRMQKKDAMGKKVVKAESGKMITEAEAPTLGGIMGAVGEAVAPALDSDRISEVDTEMAERAARRRPLPMLRDSAIERIASRRRPLPMLQEPQQLKKDKSITPKERREKDIAKRAQKKMGGGMMMQDSMGYKKGGAVRGGRKEIKGLRPAKMF